MKVAVSKEYKDLFGARAASGLALYEHHHDHEHLSNGSINPESNPITFVNQMTNSDQNSKGDKHDG